MKVAANVRNITRTDRAPLVSSTWVYGSHTDQVSCGAGVTVPNPLNNAATKAQKVREMNTLTPTPPVWGGFIHPSKSPRRCLVLVPEEEENRLD